MVYPLATCMNTEPGIDWAQSPYCQIQVELDSQRAVLAEREKREEFRGEEQPESSSICMQSSSERDDGNGLKTGEGDESCLKNGPSSSSSHDPDPDNDMPRFTLLPSIFTGPLPPPIHPAANRKPVLGVSEEGSSWKDEKFDEEQLDPSYSTNNRKWSGETDADGLKGEEGDESCSSKNFSPPPSSGDSDGDSPRFTPLPTIFSGALPPPVHPAISRRSLPSPNGYINKPPVANGVIRALQEGVARLDLRGFPSTSTATTNGASSLTRGESTSWMVVQLAPVPHFPPPPLPQSATLPQQWRRSRFMPKVRHPHDPNRVLLYGPEVNPLFEDEWCRHVNQRELQTKLQEEREQKADRDGSSIAQLPTATEAASGGAMPVSRRSSYEIMKMQRSGTRVWVEKGSELASVITTWNEEARRNALPFRGYASRQPKTISWSRGGYTLDNCHTALRKFVKRRVVTIVKQFVKRRNVSSTCQAIQVEWTIRVPALDNLNVRFESCAANLRKASQLCSLRIVSGLYEHGLVKEAELEFNRSRKDFLHPERDLPMHLRPYLECSSSFFEEILRNIEQRHGGK